jgi:hypothetical protein
MACVSICERETLAIHPATDRAAATETIAIKDVHECDGCPLSYFPKATTPEREKSVHAVACVSGLASTTPSLSSCDPNSFSDRLGKPFATASPPLKFLFLLRI